MTHYLNGLTPDIECKLCDGEGFIRHNGWPFGPDCPDCCGHGLSHEDSLPPDPAWRRRPGLNQGNDMNNDVKVYSVRIGTPKVSITEPATAREMKILQRLALLSGEGMGDFGMISRRHLKASFGVMQVLFFKGLVDGSALRDDRGHGNTPDSSLWGITKLGLVAIGYEA